VFGSESHGEKTFIKGAAKPREIKKRDSRFPPKKNENVFPTPLSKKLGRTNEWQHVGWTDFPNVFKGPGKAKVPVAW